MMRSFCANRGNESCGLSSVSQMSLGKMSVVVLDGRRRGSRKVEQISDKEQTHVVVRTASFDWVVNKMELSLAFNRSVSCSVACPWRLI